MTHRKSVVYLLHSNKKEVKEFMRHELHSVYLYKSNYDDIVGVVNLKKYLRTLMTMISTCQI
jgi:Mg2+/Co2+ transporter CorB